MAMILLAAALGAASPAPGPDAADISRLDFDEGMSLCIRIHHVVPCPVEPPVIAEVHCDGEADKEGRIRCSYTIGGATRLDTQACSARFVRAGTRWLYAPRAGAVLEPWSMEDRVEAPLCSAIGAPEGSTILAVRNGVRAELRCRVYATSPCPSTSAKINDVRCNWGTGRLAFCAYRLHDPEEYYCQARFQRAKGGWEMESYRGTDGRRAFDEYCTGPVKR